MRAAIAFSAAPVPAIFPAKLQLAFDRTEILRYGENSHQSAAFYRETNPVAGSIAAYTQLQGKELSYNNIADSDAAWECVKSFDAPACVIVKHANPCGVAIDGTLLGAYEKSFKTDSTSAFGGIIAFNGEVGIDVVNAMNERKHFVEVLIAPAFTAEAKAALAAKANLRVLVVPISRQLNALEYKRVGGVWVGHAVSLDDGHLPEGDSDLVAQPDDARRARAGDAIDGQHVVLRSSVGCETGAVRASRQDSASCCRP